MTAENDIMYFVELAPFMRGNIPELTPMDNLRELSARSNIYLEFLAGAFLKETGLKASEAELVMVTDPIGYTVRWYFRRRR